MTQALFMLCAGVAAVCAFIAIAAVRRCNELLQQATSLCTALSSERGRIVAHDAELDQITDTLRKLSGRVGALRKEHRSNSDSEGSPTGEIDRANWKARMRERYGLVPRPRD